MSGYAFDYSMSNNAIFAYDRGLMPASKITAAALRAHGITTPVQVVKYLIGKGRLRSEEWHHSSKFYNEVEFYDLDSIREQLKSIDIEEAAREMKTPSGQKHLVRLQWIDWEGSRNHPKAHEKEGVAVRTEKWFHLQNGHKKKRDGQYVKVLEIFDQVPAEYQDFFDGIKTC